MPKTVAKRAPIYWNVPADLKGRRCGGCMATIYDVRSPKNPNTTMPIDCNVPGGKRPNPGAPLLGEEPTPGRGISHFGNCPNADRFRRRRA